ncbi:hypothetical protein K505DRAFT_379804 [Melanomma pulvis-pyrius CBS 109.77]|uniref:Origin recognition complex subunit 4 n=1 Tax=Melanomma pulvis-pyrius CBS 109.77 TaxID=1314802 RepID=A0A6A6WSJ4_9PLEO|nr:hypothetical protein K505DRAFT_379804 [Melanomma pulvis-pyrius CBS 109.77]
MDDSTRSSKRRKLDTPKRIVSTPLAKSSLRRASGRLANRSASYTTAGAQEEVAEAEDDEGEHTSTRKVQLPRKIANTPSRVVNLTPAKRGLGVEKDIYDDIEGALSPTPRRRQKNAPRAGLSPLKRVQNADASINRGISGDLHEFNTIPKSRKTNGALNGESASRSSFRSLLNGYKHGAEEEAETSDELAAEGSPSKHASNGKSVNGSAKKLTLGRSATTPKSVGRASRALAKASKDIEDLDRQKTNGITVATPSKQRLTRKGSTSTRKQGATEVEEDEAATATPPRPSRRHTNKEIPTVQDFGDERGDPLPSTRAMGPKARRRLNHTDHIGHEDDYQAEAGAAEANTDSEDDMDVDGGSVLESVLDPTEPSPFNKPISAQKLIDDVPLLNGSLASGRELDLLKTIIMERITAKRPAPLIGLDAEYKTVYQLIEQTITAGEGNSMLLIGARGCGKTALVNKVLAEISKDNREDYHVVKLNGFIHTDDKIALREIWRQLGKEMDIEENGGLGKNYADTLTTLLALLSHPSEHTGELTDQVAKAVVFVMDEFDLFASHPRQTLLYNLFDIAQSRKAPIAVLGLSTRIDVANSLEKRVKSRFSHRYVHLSLASSFTQFQELCKASLLVESDQLSIEERAVLYSAPAYTPSKKFKKPAKSIKTDFLAEWNRNISSLFTSKSFLTTFLAPHFYRTKSIPQVLTSFLLPTALLSPDTPSLHPTTLLSAPDSKIALIPHLSTLSLALLISAGRLDIIHDSDTCNFNMAYDEYVTLASKARIQSAAGGASASGAVSKVWGKEVARREWEGLLELGLVMPVVGGVTGGFGMVKCDIALEEVGVVIASEKGVDRALERWCRQL